MSSRKGKRRLRSPAWVFWRAVVADPSGAAAVEFALVLPVLALLLFAVIQFGIVFNNYVQLANGVAAGARALAIGRGSATPYSDAVSAINAAAPNLNSFAAPVSGQTVTMTVGANTCTAGNQASTSCTSTFASGAAATVTLTYPCKIDVMGIGISPCTLRSSATEYMQ